jgi:hypothetical protein
MSILAIHDGLGRSALLFTIAMAAWGLWRAARRQGVDSNYWGALVVIQILYVVQAVVGFLTLAGTPVRPANTAMHILYGVVNLLLVPGIFLYTRGDDKHRSMLIYALGFLAMLGIFWRLQVTGL